MLNNSMLVGRIKEIGSNEEDGVASITIAVPRSYKNANGEYDVDSIPCLLFKGVSQPVTEYCKVGDLIGVKGRLQMKDNFMQLVAEKVSFLQSGS